MIRRVLLALGGLLVVGCMLRPSPPLGPIDCEHVDRAVQRFPEICDGGPSDDDAEADDAGTDDAGTDDAGTDDAGTDDAGTDDAGTDAP